MARTALSPQRSVLVLAAMLFALWFWVNFARVTGDPNGILRFTLGFLFSALILLRPKPEAPDLVISDRLVLPAGVGGAALVILAIVFDVRQFEWLGLLLLLFSCMRWSLPARFGGDIARALIILYWVHPLPGQLFGPLELAMQRLSVIGAGALLHTVNVRVWADGLLLHTGFRSFMVPEECSGMRTAVTVLLCGVGVGMLLRLKAAEIVGVAAAGLAQVLVLNIVRVFVMVKVGANMPQEWATNFLHDSLGVLLVVSVVAIHFEASFWKRWRTDARLRQRASRAGDQEPRDRASRIPRFWTVLSRSAAAATVIAVAAVAVAAVAYKLRPSHRVEMIRAAAEELLLTNPEAAERAIQAALRLTPDNAALKQDRLNVLVQRRKFTEALVEIRRIPPDKRTMDDRVVEAQALGGLGETARALQVISDLPEDTRNWPTVAMILAELGAASDQADVVEANVTKAAQSYLLQERVRALFPYMAARHKWRAIWKSDGVTPYRQPLHAAISFAAGLRMNDRSGAAEALRRGIKSWPREPLFLNAMLTMAMLRQGPEWEALFAETFKASLRQTDVEDLTRIIDSAFALNRPDLAWLAYCRIQSKAPEDLALPLVPARFADSWFLMRRQALNLKADTDTDTINLSSFCRLTRNLSPWRGIWSRMPHGHEIAQDGSTDIRRRYVDESLAKLRKAEETGTLTPRMDMAYPMVLEMAGRIDDALERVSKLAARYPGKRREILQEQVGLYEKTQAWPSAYEALHEVQREDDELDMAAGLRMVNCLLHLQMGVYAMTIAERFQRDLPDSDQVRSAISAIWDFYGFKEEALFLTSRLPDVERAPVMARLLFETQRYRAAAQMAKAAGGVKLPSTDGRPQTLFLPPAEWTVAWQGPTNRTAVQAQYERNRLPGPEAGVPSPFLTNLYAIRRQWLAGKAEGASSELARWTSIGRNSYEQAVALNELTMLLAGAGRVNEARGAAARAAELCPHSSMLHRILIALTGGRKDVVESARTLCPQDSEVWLAHLVAKTRADGAGTWADREIGGAIAGTRFSPGTMVRAGDFLLRNGMTNAACLAASNSIANGRGMLPAYMLGLRCALAVRDNKWALSCAQAGAGEADEPWPFYRVIVGIKTAERSLDQDLVSALESLSQRYPNENQWAEQLGDVYFSKGQRERAVAVLDAAVQKGGADVHLRTLLLAAEAARLEGKSDKALRILETAYAKYPNELSVLNNLVYCLAQEPRTTPRAIQLVDRLVTIGSNSFAALDTAAVVFLRSGAPSKAEQYMTRALKLARQGDYAWAEMNINAAEIQFSLGRYEEARRTLERIQRDATRSALADLRARDLIRRVDEQSGTLRRLW